MFNPPQPPSIFSYNPTINTKYGQFKTTDLKTVNVFLESSKNKNFNIEYNSLLVGNDLKNAEEYTNKINYGVKTIGGGVFSLNAINQKQFGVKDTQSFLGASYSVSNPYTQINFQFKNISSSNVILPPTTTLMELQIRSRF